MIKVSSLSDAQELVEQRNEILARLRAMKDRDKVWEQGLLVRISLDTLFGNDDFREGEVGLDISESFHACARQIAESIEQYLGLELRSVEEKLQALGVELQQ